MGSFKTRINDYVIYPVSVDYKRETGFYSGYDDIFSCTLGSGILLPNVKSLLTALGPLSIINL